MDHLIQIINIVQRKKRDYSFTLVFINLISSKSYSISESCRQSFYNNHQHCFVKLQLYCSTKIFYTAVYNMSTLVFPVVYSLPHFCIFITSLSKTLSKLLIFLNIQFEIFTADTLDEIPRFLNRLLWMQYIASTPNHNSPN